jgi:hypothetical protein
MENGKVVDNIVNEETVSRKSLHRLNDSRSKTLLSCLLNSLRKARLLLQEG